MNPRYVSGSKFSIALPTTHSVRPRFCSRHRPEVLLPWSLELHLVPHPTPLDALFHPRWRIIPLLDLTHPTLQMSDTRPPPPTVIDQAITPSTATDRHLILRDPLTMLKLFSPPCHRWNAPRTVVTDTPTERKRGPPLPILLETTLADWQKRL